MRFKKTGARLGWTLLALGVGVLLECLLVRAWDLESRAIEEQIERHLEENAPGGQL